MMTGGTRGVNRGPRRAAARTGVLAARPGVEAAPGPAPAPVREGGKVYLTGAGPGDPELVTLKARRILERANAIFYDELVNPVILAWAPPQCERLYVGKRDRQHSLAQADLLRLLIARARRGETVVRLKGGDPFLFGRGGEEAAALTQAGVAWEVIPGVSAGLAAPALAGIPLTHRGIAAQVTFRSGHACEGPAPGRGTQVIFMGLRRLAEVVAELLAEGWPPEAPAAVVARASWPDQQILRAPLGEIAARAALAAPPSPALVVVGDVVGWAEAGRMAAMPEASQNPPPAGIVVLAHGSPLAAWHASVERLAAELRADWARPAYLPPAEPGLAEVARQAVAAGLRRLTVVPYFLADGLHVTRDIPALVAAARRQCPELEIGLANSLQGHPALRAAVWARALERDQLERNQGAAPLSLAADAPELPPALPQRRSARAAAKRGSRPSLSIQAGGTRDEAAQGPAPVNGTAPPCRTAGAPAPPPALP